MPSVSTTLLDVEQSVARPVIFRILDQLFDITQLSKDTSIHYAGKRTSIQTPGTSIDDDQDRDAKFSAGRQTFVNVVEKYDISAVQEIFTHAFEHYPVYQDNALKASLRPIYTPSDVTISIRYRSNSETEVRRWMAEMLIRTARGRDINLHDVNYTYSIPQEYFQLLMDIWTLREKVAPYGQTFEQYLQQHTTNRLTLLANRAGQHTLLAVTETQKDIQGLFDFSVVPEDPVRDDASGSWDISFDYKFKYQRPDAIYANFPVVVHNQIMDDKYLDCQGKDYDPRTPSAYHSRSYAALHAFELETEIEQTRPTDVYIRIPDFDDFRMETSPPGTATVLTALCLLEEDRQNLLNFHDLGEYMIDSDVLAFMKTESVYLCKLFHSLIHVSVYKNHALLPYGTVNVTSDLTVRSTVELDPRAVYHVRLSLLVEINMALQACLDRLATQPRAFVKVLGALNTLLRLDPDFNRLTDRTEIKDWELKALYRILSGGSRGNNFGPIGSFDPYPFDNLQAWKTDTGREFLKYVDAKTIATYLQSKRRALVTTMTTGIIVHPVVST